MQVCACMDPGEGNVAFNAIPNPFSSEQNMFKSILTGEAGGVEGEVGEWNVSLVMLVINAAKVSLYYYVQWHTFF